MPILIQPHDAAWPLEFLRVKKELQEVLRDVAIVSVEHVGSTSIPRLVAKPVIDIDIVVKPENLSAARCALVAAGYQDRGELGVPGRVAFRQPRLSASIDGAHVSLDFRRNTYLVVEGCASLRNHLDLRRVLLEDEDLREEYGNTKKALVASGIDDVDEYCRGKNEVILKILRKAGWTEEGLEEVREANK